MTASTGQQPDDDSTLAASPPSHAAIIEVLRERYGVEATDLELLGGGLDQNAWTYRVFGREVVVRLQQGEPRFAALLVPRRLGDLGIEAVVAPIRTTDGQLLLQLQGLTWTLCSFVAGADGYHGMTDGDWQRLGAAVRAVHDATSPGDVVPRESFDVTKYDVLTEWDASIQRPGELGPSNQAFADTWNSHIARTTAMLEQMRRLADVLRRRSPDQVLCHGDLHPGNVLINPDGVHVIDWDEVRLAPRERDFIFVPCEDGPFLRGYGLLPSDIDWVALSYFRCERVIQDVLEEARRAPHDPVAAGRWLRHFFQPGGEADAARDACHHLPAHLDVLTDR